MEERIYRKTVKAAEKLFNRFGFSKTAMSDIAKEADISRATVFNNFGSKEGLLQAVLDYSEKKLRRNITICLKREKSVSEKIRAMLLERIKLLLSMKFITDETISVGPNQVIDSFMKNLNGLLKNSTARLLRNGHRNDAEVESLVNTIFFMTKGIEQGLSGDSSRFPISQVEKDLDYFLKIAVPE